MVWQALGWLFTTVEGWAVLLAVLAAGISVVFLRRRGSMSKDPFAALEPLLLDAAPQAIRALGVMQPVCCLRLYYYDTNAPEEGYGLDLRLLSATRRADLLARHGRDAPFYLWEAGEEGCDGPATDLAADPRITRLFRRVYRMICDAEDEDEVMGLLRGMLQRVSLRLNALDWSGVCPVTDDFVVAPADGSQAFADTYEDLAGSIPPARLEQLRARRLLGPDPDNWSQAETPGDAEPGAAADGGA